MSTLRNSIFSKPTQTTNLMDMNIKENAIIKVDYIISLAKKIEESYPKAEYSWQSPEYPEKDLQSAYISNKNKNDMYHRYNPFDLRIPYWLEAYEKFYDHTQISRAEKIMSYGRLHISKATSTYLNFLKEYNLAYIVFLQAINGSSQALVKLKELFTTETMFKTAQIEMDFLNKTVKNSDFCLGLLAYQALNLVYSKDNNIPTAARFKALELITQHFNLEKVAKAFQELDLGYCIDDEKSEPVSDLIPRKFITTAREGGGNPHNNLFLENPKIKEIFRIGNSKRDLNFDHGVSILRDEHPLEFLQVLHSLLRVKLYGTPVQKNYVFSAFIKLSNLDDVRKNTIFGEKASYRNNGESINEEENSVTQTINSNNKNPILPPIAANSSPLEIPVISETLKEFIAARSRAKVSNKILSSIKFPDEFTKSVDIEDLKCDITLDFPEIPVLLDGILYDYSELEKMIINGYIISPTSRQKISIANIQPVFMVQKQLDDLINKFASINKEQTDAKFTFSR